MPKKNVSRSRAVTATGSRADTNLMSMEEALAALIQRNEELISLSQSKDEFIAITSHQLRTPATGVKQYSRPLTRRLLRPFNSEPTYFYRESL
jgi:signal transduction histidine kinase